MDVKARCQIIGRDLEVYEAVSENMSRHGALLQVLPGEANGKLPMVGELVMVDLALPRNVLFGQRYLRCHGTVVRAAYAQVAVRIMQMEFRTAAPAAVELRVRRVGNA